MNTQPITNIDLELAYLRAYRAHLDNFFARRRAQSATPPADPRAQWAALVDSKVAAGMSRVAAIQAAAHERHDLYEAQSVHKSEFRAR